ncbi:MAG TPA: hypothetical protein VGD61_11530 [Pyrinomonadaceae bacterium]
MTTHTSATAQEETPHETEPTIITVSDGTKRRAESVINDRTIDPQWQTIIRYALEVNDPWLDELVSRAEAGENFVDTFESIRMAEADEDDLTVKKIDALAEIICRASDEATVALLVLMGLLENCKYPKEAANTAKYFAFNYCTELNLYGMVDAQVAMFEAKVLANNTVVS